MLVLSSCMIRKPQPIPPQMISEWKVDSIVKNKVYVSKYLFYKPTLRDVRYVMNFETKDTFTVGCKYYLNQTMVKGSIVKRKKEETHQRKE